MKRSSLNWLLTGIFLFYVGIIHAQAACPPGTIPYGTGQGQNMCGPDNSQRQSRPRPPPQVWEPRWGAIATDGDGGSFGASANTPDQESADQAALADCGAKKGSSKCKIEIDYGNQCVAMAAGDIGYNTKSGLTSNLAAQLAMKVCSAATTHCHVYYTACSMPQQIQ
jgi:hypothetical protein